MTSTVFVSSTFLDLQTHRKAVWETLASFDVNVRGMEQFGARTETPLQTCLLEVDQSTDRKFNRMRPSMARVFGFETRRPRQTKAD